MGRLTAFVLFELLCDLPVQKLALDELIMQVALVLIHCLQVMAQVRHDFLMVFVHFVQLEGLVAEPISFPLQVHESTISLRLDPLSIRLLFQVSHVPLNDVHLLFEGLQEVIFMLFNFSLDELSSVLCQSKTDDKVSK